MGNLSHVAMLNILYNKICVHEMVHKQYREFRGHRYHGSYWPISGQPILTINDLDLVQHVLSKVAKSSTFVTSCQCIILFMQLEISTTSQTGTLSGYSGIRVPPTMTGSGDQIYSP